MAAKQLVTNIHKRLNICAVTVPLITTVNCWTSRIAGSEEDKAELRDALRSGRPTADEEGVMLADIMPHGHGSNSEQYSKTLKILQKRFTGVRPHKLLLTSSFKRAKHKFQKTEVITEVERTILPHPPHNPNLARSDFLGGLRDAMRGKRFGRDDEVTEEVQ
jgi:hypothetical protein